MGFSQEHSVGHDLDESLPARFFSKPDFVTDGSTDLFTQFLCNSVGNGDRCDSSGLGASDFPRKSSFCLDAHLGNLSALSAAGLSGNNDDLVFFDQPDDLLSLGGDGEAFGKSNQGSMVESVLSFLHRGPRLAFHRGQKVCKLPGFSFSAPLSKDSVETTGQDFPVPQHGLGQEKADFLNAFVC
jgi:hypothetical protein